MLYFYTLFGSRGLPVRVAAKQNRHKFRRYPYCAYLPTGRVETGRVPSLPWLMSTTKTGHAPSLLAHSLGASLIKYNLCRISYMLYLP